MNGRLLAATMLATLAAVVALVSVGPDVRPAAASASPPAGIDAVPGTPSARMLKCSRGKAPGDRWALFRGAMTQIAGGARMQMRFSLDERVGSSSHWRGIRAPGLDVWHEARPDVARFAYRQRIAALQVATSYRVDVAYRWYDAAGRRIAKQYRTSSACRQPGKLPNLFLRDDVTMRPGPTPDTARYGVRVGNDGNATARGVTLVLTVDGAEVDTRTIGRLRKGERRLLRFVGPRCLARVEAEIDPGDVVREISESDNRRTGACPAPPST